MESSASPLRMLNRWWKISEEYQPPRSMNVPVGAAEFDSWLRCHLYGYAATSFRTGLTRNKFHEILTLERERQILAHNEMRPNDIWWQRALEFESRTVTRILEEANPYLSHD